MPSSFYSNDSEVKFIDKLRQNLDKCISFSFSVSFIKKPGLCLLAPNMEAAIARGACGRVINYIYLSKLYGYRFIAVLSPSAIRKP